MKKLNLLAGAALASHIACAPVALHARPRADASDPKALIEQLNVAFAAFKEKHEEELKSRVSDTVLTEHVDRINADVSRIEAALDKAMADIAAASVGGGDQVRDPEYTDQFRAYFRSGVESQRLNELKAQATKTDGEGGFLAPVEWDRTIGQKLKQVSRIREEASVQVISSAGFSKVFSDRATGSGWVGEQASRPETTTPTLASLAFPLGELYANPAASQGLIDDAEVDIEAWLAEEVGLEFARQEGIAFLSGDGSNKPHGLLTYVTGGANAARHPFGAITLTNSGNASLLNNADAVLDLVYSLPEEFEANAKFFMNRATSGVVRKLKSSGSGDYLWQPSTAAGQPSTLCGAPVVHLPGMPTVAANAIAMLYGDMRETYQVVDRIGLRVLRDPYTRKPFVHFYTTKRVGGGVKNPEAMKGLKISA